MPVKRCLPSLQKGIMINFFILLCIGSVFAKTNLPKEFVEVKIIVSISNPKLLPLFDLIQKQTSLVFVYDESEVNLNLKIKLPTGEQSLSKLLDIISRQTGLLFTRKENTILVSSKPLMQQKQVSPIITPVKGSVKDASGNPMIGATISVKGTNIKVLTDNDGNFSLNVPDNAVLVISYTGYKTQEFAMNGRSELLVNMVEFSAALNEVVVMGYQTQKRAAISGAVTTVNVDDVSKIPIGFADQALQGQASGVRITQSTGQPGDGVAIRIRGVGSINNNDPLFVIDGVPTTDGINFLAADDIASITVLKDASSAAIYGARSTNGVIVITTKAGKAGKVQMSYSVYTGVQTHGFLTPMTNAQEYKTLFNEMVANDNAGLAPNSPLIKTPISDSIPMANTNWLGAIFRTAPMQDHELSVSGGNDKTQYFISANAFKQDGIILNSWYQRYP